MKEEKFKREMMKARALGEHGDELDYWAGYQRGLRRRFHGENFGTDEEHEIWMGLLNDFDPSRSERGRGYRDGFKPEPEYCTQNDGDCTTCSLVNYGRDCVNNPIP